MDLSELDTILGPGAVVRDPDLLAGASVDWTGRWRGSTPALLLPSSTAQVVEVIRWCAAHHVGLVPQGGNTGLVGGGVPLAGELVLSTRRLDGIVVDAAAGTLVAGAGVTVAAVQSAAAAAGWRYGVDFGARDSATIGGTVATNAGGLHVIRNGDTRHQLLGVEAVTGAGEVVGDLRGLVKDNTGYHLPSLLAGSEGTLAVITRVCVRLLAAPADVATALVGFDSLDAAVAAVGPLRLALPDLQALELVLDDGLELVCREFGLARPFATRCGAYLIVEIAGAPGAVDRLAAALGDHVAADDAVAVATDERRRGELWRYREAHTEAITMVGIPHKLDVTVPLAAMVGFVDSVRSLVANHTPDAHVWIFGHAGDGNLHVNITGCAPDDDGLDRAVLESVAALGGSISAEHGIGRAKARALGLNRTPAELAVQLRLRAAFDPAGILNPGVLHARE